MTQTGSQPDDAPDGGSDSAPQLPHDASLAPQPDGAPATTSAALVPAIETRLIRHPNLGLAPVDMSAGFPEVARRIRAAAPRIAARALEVAIETDRGMRERFDRTGLRRLVRDTEVLAERLSACVASGDSRFLVDHAESMQPIYRRRGASLLDLAALCAAIGRVVERELGPEERSMAERSLGEAIAVLRAGSRLAGDARSRNALWSWMYKGV